MRPDSPRQDWLGYSEARRYRLPDTDPARTVRAHARALGWAEVGALAGPRLVFCEPGAGVWYEIELRPDATDLWLLLRTHASHPLDFVDPLTAERAARLFGELERGSLGAPRERVRLPADYRAWPADLGTLREADRPLVRLHSARAWLLPSLTLVVVAAADLASQLLDGRGLLGTLFVGVFGALWRGLVWAGVVALGVGAVALATHLDRERRRRRLERALAGESSLFDRPLRPVDVDPGGLEPEPHLERAPLRWRPLGAELQEAFGDSRRHLAAYSCLAVVVLTVAVPLAWSMQWLVTAVLPAAAIAGIGAAWPATATALGGGLLILIGLPILAGVLALRRRAGIEGSSLGVVLALSVAVPRLPTYFAAQVAVIGGVVGILFAGLLPGLLLEQLTILTVPAAIACAAWFVVAHSLVGPIAFLEPDSAPLARSRELTRGATRALLGSLAVVGAVSTALVALLATLYEVLVWRNPVVDWLPTPVLATVESLLPFVVAPFAAACLASLYFRQRCLREDLDIVLATGEDDATTAATPTLDAPRNPGDLILDLPVPATVALIVALLLGLYLAPSIDLGRTDLPGAVRASERTDPDAERHSRWSERVNAAQTKSDAPTDS